MDDASFTAVLQYTRASNDLKVLQTDLAYIHANLHFQLLSITKAIAAVLRNNKRQITL
jgi:hypothetical protein